MAKTKKKVEPETWPKRDEVNDEDTRQSSNDDPRERAQEEHQGANNDEARRSGRQSRKADPDSAHADVNRDDTIDEP